MKIKEQTKIELKNLKLRTIEVPITGISPLIVHRFGSKAQKMIEDKKMGKAKSSKHEICDPTKEYEDAKHIAVDGWEGFPCGGIKQAIVRGAKAVGLVMTDVRSSIFIEPDCKEKNLVKIHGKSELRKDHVRIGNGAADVRYRPVYNEWNIVLTITYNEGVVSKDQLLQSIYAGGYGTGIGDWRPEKGGDYGRWTILGIDK